MAADEAQTCSRQGAAHLRFFIVGGTAKHPKRVEERTRSHGLELLRSVDPPGV